MKIMAIQEQIGRGEYQVDERAVAEAILRRMLGKRGLRTSTQGRPSA
jgi:Anti-sigma-28 factor, FlgM